MELIAIVIKQLPVSRFLVPGTFRETQNYFPKRVFPVTGNWRLVTGKRSSFSQVMYNMRRDPPPIFCNCFFGVRLLAPGACAQ
jgi:hypothetical protein